VECTSTTKVGEYVAPTTKRCTRSSAHNYATISASGHPSPSFSSHAPKANVPDERHLPELARAASLHSQQPDKERGLMVLRKTRRLWTEAGGVTATRDISRVPVTILLLVEIARHF